MKLLMIKKYLYILGGSVAFILGLIGIFVPVLPTTPLLLLASFCYLRSSQRMYNWLINHKIFGAYIYSYMTYKAVPKKTKISAMTFLWLMLMISMLLVSSSYIRIFLVVVGIGVTIHLISLKTLSQEDFKNREKLERNKY